MHEWLQTLRALGKQRGYAAVVVLTLAFGIGVSASLFSMVSAFFLQPLPVKDAGQLVLLMQRGRVWGLPYGRSTLGLACLRLHAPRFGARGSGHGPGARPPGLSLRPGGDAEGR